MNKICDSCGFGDTYTQCGCGKWRKGVINLLARIADSLEARKPTRYNPAHIYADFCTRTAGLEDTNEIKKEVKKILGLEE